RLGARPADAPDPAVGREPAREDREGDPEVGPRADAGERREADPAQHAAAQRGAAPAARQGGGQARRGGTRRGPEHPPGGQGEAARARQGPEDLRGRREAERGRAPEADRPHDPADRRGAQEEGAGDPRVLTGPTPADTPTHGTESLALGPPPAPAEPDAGLLRSLRTAPLPRHVAIIMDGNGRWA